MRQRLYAELVRHPRAHELARRGALFGRHLARRPHDPDFAVFRRWPERTGTFLDVGANAGMSALAFRLYNRRSPILSIEPNPLHEPDLKLVGRMIRSFDYLLCGASDEAGSLTLYTPVVRGVPATGEASLSREVAEGRRGHILSEYGIDRLEDDGFEIAETTVPVRPLDELEVEAAFVKLDVQGWEMNALRGLRRTLERHRPVLFIENGPYMDEVVGFLGELGFDPHAYDPAADALEPYAGERVLNVVFAPR